MSQDEAASAATTPPTPPPEATEEVASSGFSMPEIVIPDFVIEYLIYGLKWLPILLVLWFLYKVSLEALKYIETQRVCGKPNEWVIIIRDGEQQQAGIGLNTYKTPWDTVAIFPSRNVKVEVRTEQVTVEMQGIGVSTMLEWTIDKNFPLKAYKNLDLASGNFNKANDILQSMVSAIVRNQIANSTIDHIIKNR